MTPPRHPLGGLVDFLLPPVCLACDGIIDVRDEARLVCRRCRARLRPVPTPACVRCGATRRVTGRSLDEPCTECAHWPDSLIAARSACLLQAPADRIVHQFKYHGWSALAGPMAERLAALRLPEVMRNTVYCVPVPTTDARRRERGYNQAGLLARAFARATRRRECDALRRDARGGSQTSLQPLARRANVAAAFRPDERSASCLRGTDVLLVDDVLTTGATAAACALALSEAGVRGTCLITFARALDAPRLSPLNGERDHDG